MNNKVSAAANFSPVRKEMLTRLSNVSGFIRRDNTIYDKLELYIRELRYSEKENSQFDTVLKPISRNLYQSAKKRRGDRHCG
jgi:hypothetical protein